MRLTGGVRCKGRSITEKKETKNISRAIWAGIVLREKKKEEVDVTTE